MSLSAIVPEKSRGNKKCDEEEEEEERHILDVLASLQNGRDMVVYATLLISICSFCRGQHADVTI